jgi:signal transduction histidine kinase
VRGCAARLALAFASALGVFCGASHAAAVEPDRADVIEAADALPPADADPRWRAVTLPHAAASAVAWYRVSFERDAVADAGFSMLYLPYFYGGGRVWLNDEPVAAVTENSPELRVRWERPLLLPLPSGALKAGRNVVLLRAVSAHQPSGTMLPRLVLGDQSELQPQFDRRLFFVRTVPLVTVITGCTVGLLVLLIWWRRPQEVLYGWFGLAALLWAMRTTTFVFDALPGDVWTVWRAFYFASTGGFIVVMALFALELAGWSRPLLTRGLVAYWALGPLAYVMGSANAEVWLGKWWIAGLLPVGLGIAVVALAAAWRQRTVATVAIALGVVLAFLTGLHDYFVAWRAAWLDTLLPVWTAHRVFLLHHGANLLLIVMGVQLAARFVRSLHEVEQANRMLEARVAEREREIVASYEHIAQLQREQAATDERQRIMRDLHDGLGSQLFTSLSRAERGALDTESMAETLRRAIDEMRLAIEALASDDQDFRTAFGNFRFRWEPRLREAGVTPAWTLDLPDAVLALPPHDALQILRIAQEALTNVLKHARATRVGVRLRAEASGLELEITDDGRGVAVAAAETAPSGRGHANMRARAEGLGGTLDIETDSRGTRVLLRLPKPAQ